MTPPVECVILVGIPGAGKTTLRLEKFPDHQCISKDAMPNVRDKQARQVAALRAALGARRSVVVDNTNVTQVERGAIIALARAFGARLIGYYLETSTRDAVARNERRHGKAKVPKVAIFAEREAAGAAGARRGVRRVAHGHTRFRIGRRFARAAASGNATILACRLGRATSHVRAHASHSYSCRSCTGRRARMRGDWQKGQDVMPDMVTLRFTRAVHSLFRRAAEGKLSLR